MFWGLSNEKWGPLPLPLKLDGIGAKDNALHISLDLFALPLAIIKSGNTYYGRQVLPIPNTNDMRGPQSLHAADALRRGVQLRGLRDAAGACR